MSHPTLPPYLGSWDHLLRALLHDPFLGSGKKPVHKAVEALMAGPGSVEGDPMPTPWSAADAIASLVRLAGLREAVSALPQERRTRLIGSVDAAIAAYIDDEICPPPRRWPIPGPHPWPFVVASELAVTANTFAEGALRTTLLK